MGKVKLILDIGKKLFPNASKKIQNLAKKEYDDARITMSPSSAESYARASIRDTYKTDFSGNPIKKNLGGGISSGPPPKKGPNSHGIQIKGFKFSGIK